MNAVQMPLAEPSALTDSRSAGRISTSRAAFRALRDSGKQRIAQQRVADYVTARGADGATSHEACKALGMLMQSMSGRLNELMRAGYLYRAGDVRNGAKVWRWVGLVPSAGASSNSKWEGSDVPADGLSAGRNE